MYMYNVYVYNSPYYWPFNLQLIINYKHYTQYMYTYIIHLIGHYYKDYTVYIYTCMCKYMYIHVHTCTYTCNSPYWPFILQLMPMP